MPVMSTLVRSMQKEGHSQLPNKVEANLDYRRPCLKYKNETQWEEEWLSRWWVGDPHVQRGRCWKMQSPGGSWAWAAFGIGAQAVFSEGKDRGCRFTLQPMWRLSEAPDWVCVCVWGGGAGRAIASIYSIIFGFKTPDFVPWPRFYLTCELILGAGNFS